jgi:glucose/mannose transport system substrate-binding protein
MLNRGTAGMLLIGDWAKAEMLAARKRHDIDILCAPTRDADGAFS